jgi:hypothetical protein
MTPETEPMSIRIIKIFCWGLLFAAVGLSVGLLQLIGQTQSYPPLALLQRLPLDVVLTATLWDAFLGFGFGIFLGIVRSIKRKVNPPPLP